MAATTWVDQNRWGRPKRLLLCFVVAFIFLGISLRFLRLGANFPLWGDEAFVALNFFDSDFNSLTKPLRHYQIAPLGFLWLEKTATLLLGTSEFTLRITPCLAGIFALLKQLCLPWLLLLFPITPSGILAKLNPTPSISWLRPFFSG